VDPRLHYRLPDKAATDTMAMTVREMRALLQRSAASG